MIKIIKSEPLLNFMPVMASEKYLSLRSTNYGWIVSDNFCLPFFISKQLFFRRLVFTTEVIKINAKKDASEKDFLNSVIKELQRRNLCDFIYKAQSNVVFNEHPDGADVVNWGTYITDLSVEGDIINCFHGKHRNVIRKAIKSGVVIKTDEDPAICYELIRDTMKRQRVIHYPSLDYLCELKEKMPNNSFFLSSYFDNVLQGVSVIVFDSDSAYYLYGGSKSNPHTGAINYMHYYTMNFLRDNFGVKKYDFVGARLEFDKNSKYEGLDRFKSRFGGDLKKGFAFRYIFNKKKFYIFNLLVKTYSFLKGCSYTDPIESIKSQIK